MILGGKPTQVSAEDVYSVRCLTRHDFVQQY